MSFIYDYDIANRGLQHLGQPRIASFSDLSMQAVETGFAYDKVRRAELRRAVWTFSTRRMIIRAYTAGTTQRIIFPVYSSTQAYTAGDVVQDSVGYLWLCLISATGVAPGTQGYYPTWAPYFGQMYADPHSVSVTYFPGDTVTSAGAVYLCINLSLNHAPPNATYWHLLAGTPTFGGGGILSYSPVGYLPTPAASTVRKVFPLPANFMRLAAQDPKAAGTAHNTITAGMKWSDWELEDGVLYSPTLASPTVLRFCADVRDVTRMDDMFCEALAAKMGMSLSNRFANSAQQFADIEKVYDASIVQARAMSSIEAGSTEDDFQAPEPPQQRR